MFVTALAWSPMNLPPSTNASNTRTHARVKCRLREKSRLCLFEMHLVNASVTTKRQNWCLKKYKSYCMQCLGWLMSLMPNSFLQIFLFTGIMFGHAENIVFFKWRTTMRRSTGVQPIQTHLLTKSHLVHDTPKLTCIHPKFMQTHWVCTRNSFKLIKWVGQHSLIQNCRWCCWERWLWGMHLTTMTIIHQHKRTHTSHTGVWHGHQHPSTNLAK